METLLLLALTPFGQKGVGYILAVLTLSAALVLLAIFLFNVRVGPAIALNLLYFTIWNPLPCRRIRKIRLLVTVRW